MSYLEEYDQSKQKSNRKDDYSGKYSEIVEEDINLRLGSSKKLQKRRSSDGSIEDLVVDDNYEDSIREDIEGSAGGSSVKSRSVFSGHGTPRDYKKAFD